VHPPLLDRLWLNAVLGRSAVAGRADPARPVPPGRDRAHPAARAVRRAHAASGTVQLPPWRATRSPTAPARSRSGRARLARRARARTRAERRVSRSRPPSGSSRDEAYRRVPSTRGSGATWTCATGRALDRQDGASARPRLPGDGSRFTATTGHSNVSASHTGRGQRHHSELRLAAWRASHRPGGSGRASELAPESRSHFMLGLRAAGVPVYDLGTVHTPLIYHALAYFREPAKRGRLPRAENHFKRRLEQRASAGKCTRMMPALEDQREPRCPAPAVASGTGRGARGYTALERDQRPIRPPGRRRDHEDNAMARRHAAMVESLVSSVRRSRSIYSTTEVYEKNDYQHLVDTAERRGLVCFSAGEEWRRFAEELDLPLGKYPRHPRRPRCASPFGDVPARARSR